MFVEAVGSQLTCVYVDHGLLRKDEVAKSKLDTQMNQYFAVLTNMKSVGVMGDGRTYDLANSLRSVTTGDFMTLQVSHLQQWNSSKEG